jgi:hypothetical protein
MKALRIGVIPILLVLSVFLLFISSHQLEQHPFVSDHLQGLAHPHGIAGWIS